MKRTRKLSHVDIAEKTKSLYRLGKSWGLADKTILKCAMKSLKRDISETPERIVCMKRILKCVIVSVVVMLMMLYYVHEEPWMQPTMMMLEYHTTRAGRLVLRPLLSSTGRDDYIEEDCLVSNPLYNEVRDCGPCTGISDVIVLRGTPRHVPGADIKLGIHDVHVVVDVDNNITEYKPFSFSSILLHQNSADPVYLFELVSWLKQHEHVMADSTMQCTPDGSIPVTQLITENNFDNKSCSWNILSLPVNSVMRKLLSRPALAPPETDLAPVRNIYLDASGLGARTLDLGFLDYIYTWYFQAQGERTVLFSPRTECEDVCSQVKVKIKEGETLIFPYNMWRVEMLQNSAAFSIGCEGYLFL